ncbi:DUF4760 domain-containing protein [Symbioplanes lichenis]|uniref:DUF4760 domain-containing protein n=1 Tax=Symbioplanes lichenis TaxID=1629072 RepID=UPI002738E830|nr:hypothetical protein [Actinoplanes lichenis]
MGAQTLLAAFAVVISIAALAVSSALSWRQLRSMRSANHVPVAIEMLTRAYGNPEFQRAELDMLARLPTLDPKAGFSGLPESLLTTSLQVIAFYDSMGILVAFGCVDEVLVLSSINFRIRRVWRTLEPFVLAERRLRQGLYLDFLEDLAARAEQSDPQRLHERLGLRSMRPSRA